MCNWPPALHRRHRGSRGGDRKRWAIVVVCGGPWRGSKTAVKQARARASMEFCFCNPYCGTNLQGLWPFRFVRWWDDIWQPNTIRLRHQRKLSGKGTCQGTTCSWPTVLSNQHCNCSKKNLKKSQLRLEHAHVSVLAHPCEVVTHRGKVRYLMRIKVNVVRRKAGISLQSDGSRKRPLSEVCKGFQLKREVEEVRVCFMNFCRMNNSSNIQLLSILWTYIGPFNNEFWSETTRVWFFYILLCCHLVSTTRRTMSLLRARHTQQYLEFQCIVCLAS